MILKVSNQLSRLTRQSYWNESSRSLIIHLMILSRLYEDFFQSFNISNQEIFTTCGRGELNCWTVINPDWSGRTKPSANTNSSLRASTCCHLYWTNKERLSSICGDCIRLLWSICHINLSAHLIKQMLLEHRPNRELIIISLFAPSIFYTPFLADVLGQCWWCRPKNRFYMNNYCM